MTRRRYVRAWRLYLLGLCLVMPACSRGNETPAGAGTVQGDQSPAVRPSVEATGNVTIEFRSEPDPLEAGDNTFEVIVRQADGSPVTDAAVTAVFSMPAMPSMNMPPMRSTASLSHEAAGRYRGVGQLSMNGTWNVTITVSRGSSELGSKRFSVVAK